MEGIPTFYGYSQEAVQEFVDDLRSYFAAKDIAAARWIGILTTQLRGPARTQHIATLQVGQPLQVAVAAAVAGGGGAAVIAAASFECHVDWLNETFHTEEVQQRIQDQLISLRQSSNESPRDFYTRICHLAQVARMDPAVYPHMTAMVFMNGTHQDIADHVKTFGHRAIGEKVVLAQSYWLVRNPGMSTNSLAQVLPRGLHKKLNPTIPMIQQAQATTNLFREPAIVATPAAREDPGIEEITKKFALMEAHIMDLEGQVKNRTGYRHDNTRGAYPARTDNWRSMDKTYMTCHLCHQKGHFAKECTKRTWQDGRPTTGLNVITYEDDEEDEDVVDIYPVQGRPIERARRTGTPYPKKRPQTEPVVEIPTRTQNRNKPTEEQWEAAFDDANREQSIDTDMQEEAAIRRKRIKEFDYDIWRDLSAQKPNLTFKQLFQVAPALKASVKRGITEERPTIRFADANQLNNTEEEDTIPRRTSAYVTCQITNYPVNAIVDTGAGTSIIAKHVLDRLGWEIEKPAKTILVIADGSKSTPLGEVTEVPITFGNETISIDMIVTASETYQIILGNNWLFKAKANIDLQRECMTFLSRGRKFRVPVSTTKGVRPDIVDEETDWQPRRNEVEDEEPYLNIDEIFQAEESVQQEQEETPSETTEDTEWSNEEESSEEYEKEMNAEGCSRRRRN